jgi:hypothetical protein
MLPAHRWTSRYLLIVAVMAVGSACSSSAPPEPVVDLMPMEARVVPEVAAATITAADMLAHISYLASDELGGRDTPSPGLELAAAYLAEAFRTAGLEPAGDEGDYVQRWAYEKKSLLTSESMVAYGETDERVELEYASDFFIIPAHATAVRGSLTYAGPIGAFLDSPPGDLAGRVVAVTTPPSVGMEMLGAIRAAADAGAAGLLIILNRALPPDVVGMVAGQVTAAGLPLQPVPAVGVSYGVAAEMFSAGAADLDRLVSSWEGETVEFSTAPIGGVEVSIVAPLDREASTPPNVVALLRGRDPKLAHTYVVLSAHFDHVGIGEPDAAGDSIYNGADDDASGTSVLLEVAEAFQSMPQPPSRSVLFLAVSGEEKGLLGSGHYASHPTVPIEAIVANINLDMVGRNAPDTVIAIGQEYSTLGPLVERIAAEHLDLGLTVAPDPDPTEQAFFRSDHLMFVKQDIPAIFLTTWDHDDYHMPSDEASEIDADKAARIARLTFLLTWEIAEDPRAPDWNEGALDEVREILADSPI